jgi:cytidine deaminase
MTLDPEDAKILTLARSARLRAYAPHTGITEGAAIRDTDGRTYAAATVENADPALTVSALRAAVAAAASSGARTFEAAALVTEADEVDLRDLAFLAEFGDTVPILLAGGDGTIKDRETA